MSRAAPQTSREASNRSNWPNWPNWSNWPNRSSQTTSLCFALAVAVAIGLKLALLFTSQSMADGDEAVEGLMALHILQDGVHPVYPYGVRYGAGAGIEAHLAALFFAVFGVSSIALKSVGLCVWLTSGALIRAIAAQQWGSRAGWIALAAWGFAPFSAQWSLKVAGGHNVAVALALLALWLGVSRRRHYAAVAVLPLAVIAHPVVLPLCLGIALALLWRAPGGSQVGGRVGDQVVDQVVDRLGDRVGDRVGDRLAVASALALAAGVALGLWPEGQGVWTPAARGFEPAAIARALPHVSSGLFTANLNARSLPGLFDGAVALVWALAVVASLVSLSRSAPEATGAGHEGQAAGAPEAGGAVWWLLLVAPFGALLIVQPEELAPRHLLPVLPIFCLLLGRWLASLPPTRALVLMALLASTGAAVQLHEMTSPSIHGAGPHGRGVERRNVRDLLAELEREGVRHVYSGDAMLQWMLVFESQERVIARWREPRGRVPRYVAEVERARLAGEPLRLVVVEGKPAPGAPLRFGLRPLPQEIWLERAFPADSNEDRR